MGVQNSRTTSIRVWVSVCGYVRVLVSHRWHEAEVSISEHHQLQCCHCIVWRGPISMVSLVVPGAMLVSPWITLLSRGSVRRELRSQGYSYSLFFSLFNGEPRSYFVFPNQLIVWDFDATMKGPRLGRCWNHLLLGIHWRSVESPWRFLVRVTSQNLGMSSNWRITRCSFHKWFCTLDLYIPIPIPPSHTSPWLCWSHSHLIINDQIPINLWLCFHWFHRASPFLLVASSSCRVGFRMRHPWQGRIALSLTLGFVDFVWFQWFALPPNHFGGIRSVEGLKLC